MSQKRFTVASNNEQCHKRNKRITQSHNYSHASYGYAAALTPPTAKKQVRNNTQAIDDDNETMRKQYQNTLEHQCNACLQVSDIWLLSTYCNHGFMSCVVSVNLPAEAPGAKNSIWKTWGNIKTSNPILQCTSRLQTMYLTTVCANINATQIPSRLLQTSTLNTTTTKTLNKYKNNNI